MLVHIFNIIKNIILKNEVLSSNIKCFELLEARDDTPMPYMIFDNFKSNNIYPINGMLLCIEFWFDLTFILDLFDQDNIDKIIENTILSLYSNTKIEYRQEINIKLNHQDCRKENDLWKLKYKFSGVFFVRNKLFHEQ